jgi:aminoglycoside/choline kinase family phosphotransferase
VKDGYQKEVRFYQELGARVHPHVPRCWYAAITDDACAFTLLLDDLQPAVPGVQADGCSFDEAAAAVRNLAGIHAATWCDDALRADRWLQPWDAESGRFLGDVLVGAVDQFLDRYGEALGPADAGTLRAAASSTGAWAATPVEHVAVVHGDYRLDNLMFAPDGTVTALDWQTATFGSPTRDLAYFLETSLDVALRRRHEQELLGIYADALVGGGVERDAAEGCLAPYPADLRQGPLITVLGAVYATAMRSDAADRMFLAMATRSCAALRDHGTLDGVPA